MYHKYINKTQVEQLKENTCTSIRPRGNQMNFLEKVKDLYVYYKVHIIFNTLSRNMLSTEAYVIGEKLLFFKP